MTSQRRTTATTVPPFSGYGIGSAVVGVDSVAAIVLAALIWTQHRSDVDELRYRTGAMQAAADWTSVLINMNKDTVEASLAQLHEGTVGQLNADFDAAVRPYRDLVQKLQSRTTGQVDSVAVEFVHHEQPRHRGAAAAATRHVAVRLPHRHRAGRGHVDQRERRQRQAADGALDAAAGRLRHRRQADDLPAGADPMRNTLRIVAFDVAPPLAAIAALVYIGVALGLAAVVGVGCVRCCACSSSRASWSTSYWRAATG